LVSLIVLIGHFLSKIVGRAADITGRSLSVLLIRRSKKGAMRGAVPIFRDIR